MTGFDPDIARKILAIEAQTWVFAGRKEAHVREVLDVSMTRYYQLLNDLINTELALQIDALTTRRLQRIRAQRLHTRSA